MNMRDLRYEYKEGFILRETFLGKVIGGLSELFIYKSPV